MIGFASILPGPIIPIIHIHLCRSVSAAFGVFLGIPSQDGYNKLPSPTKYHRFIDLYGLSIDVWTGLSCLHPFQAG